MEENMIEAHCSFLIQSPGGRDEGLWCRQWDPSLLPPPLPLPPSVTAGVNVSICASECHPGAGTCKYITKLFPACFMYFVALIEILVKQHLKSREFGQHCLYKYIDHITRTFNTDLV